MSIEKTALRKLYDHTILERKLLLNSLYTNDITMTFSYLDDVNC